MQRPAALRIACAELQQAARWAIDPDPPGMKLPENHPWHSGLSDAEAALVWLWSAAESPSGAYGVGLYALCEILTGRKFFDSYWEGHDVFMEIERRLSEADEGQAAGRDPIEDLAWLLTDRLDGSLWTMVQRQLGQLPESVVRPPLRPLHLNPAACSLAVSLRLTPLECEAGASEHLPLREFVEKLPERLLDQTISLAYGLAGADGGEPRSEGERKSREDALVDAAGFVRKLIPGSPPGLKATSDRECRVRRVILYEISGNADRRTTRFLYRWTGALATAVGCFEPAGASNPMASRYRVRRLVLPYSDPLAPPPEDCAVLRSGGWGDPDPEKVAAFERIWGLYDRAGVPARGHGLADLAGYSGQSGHS